MDINFEYYKIFYYVARYGNITKAAAALGSNQPNVTRIIKLLEAQLGCRLLAREARGISLTEEGKRLYTHVEIACIHLFEAQEEIGVPPEGRGGTVKIGATETALHLFLLNMLRDFKREYPAVRIKIRNHTTPEILKQLIAGMLDFAVITAPFDVSGPLLREKVLEFRDILVGGAAYGDLCKKELDLNDIKEYPLVGLGEGTATYEMYRTFFAGHQVDMEPDMEAATSDLILPLIENNLGIGFIPEKLAGPLLEEKRLVRIGINYELPKRSIEIVSDRGRAKNGAAELLYRYLKKAEG